MELDRFEQRRDHQRMDDGVQVLVGPRRSWLRGLWLLLGGRVHPGWNALWLTDHEVVIANSKGTHVVPKAGAGAVVVDEEQWSMPTPEFDNSRTAMRRLYVVPGDPSLERIQVEAAEGLTPRKLAAVVEALEAAFEEAL